MGFFNNFPYTNFHDLNLDWILKAMKKIESETGELIKDFALTREEFEKLKTYVDEFINNTNIEQAVNNKLDEMYNNGELGILLSRLLSFISVKAYGAVGDGVTDDSGAFNKALSENSAVLVPDGTYYIGSPIEMKPGTTLFAFTKGNSYLKYSESINCINLSHDNRIENLIIETNNGENYAIYGNDSYNINIFRTDNLGGSFKNTRSRYFKIEGKTWHTVLIYNCVVDCGATSGFAMVFDGDAGNVRGVNRDVHIGYSFIDTLLMEDANGGCILFNNVYGPSVEYSLIRTAIDKRAMAIITSGSGGKSDLWSGMNEIRTGKMYISENSTLFETGYSSVVENNGDFHKFTDNMWKIMQDVNKIGVVGNITKYQNYNGSLSILIPPGAVGITNVSGISIPISADGCVVHLKSGGIQKASTGWVVGVYDTVSGKINSISGRTTVKYSDCKNGSNVVGTVALEANALSNIVYTDRSTVHGSYNIAYTEEVADIWVNTTFKNGVVNFFVSKDGIRWANIFTTENLGFVPTHFIIGADSNIVSGFPYEKIITIDNIVQS